MRVVRGGDDDRRDRQVVKNRSVIDFDSGDPEGPGAPLGPLAIATHEGANACPTRCPKSVNVILADEPRRDDDDPDICRVLRHEAAPRWAEVWVPGLVRPGTLGGVKASTCLRLSRVTDRPASSDPCTCRTGC